MHPVIRLEFTPTLRTYLLFNRHVLRHAYRWLRPFAVFALICFLLSPLFPFEGNPSVWDRYRTFIGALILPGLIFVLLPRSVYLSAKRRWASAADLRERRAYDFSEAGLTVTGGTFHGSTTWANILRAETAGPMILLYNGQRQAHLIPLDAFTDPQQAEAFKSLLRQKVPDFKRLR